MSRCDPRARSASGEKAGEAVNGSAPEALASLRSAFRGVEGSPKLLAAMSEAWRLDIEEIEALGKENEVLRASLEDEARDSGALREGNGRLRARVANLQDEVRMLEEENGRLRAKVASLEDEVRRGKEREREEVAMLEATNDRLRRSEELLREMKMVLESKKAAAVLGSEEEVKDGEGENGVPGKADGFDVENGDSGGDGVVAPKGDDFGVGGGASSSRKLRTMLYFGQGTCASATTSAVSSDKCLVKESVVLRGDGRTPLKEVEVCGIDDCVAGSGHSSGNYLSYQKPTEGRRPGESNQETEKRELKRKRGSCLDLIEWENKYNHDNGAGISLTQAGGRNMNKNVSIPVCPSTPASYGLHKSLNQSVQDVTIVKQHEQKSIKGQDSKSSSSKLTMVNSIVREKKVGSDTAIVKQHEQKYIKGQDCKDSSSKLTVVNSIAHEEKVASDTAKPGDGSSLRGGAWKKVEELCSDLERDDELCLKAICALYRRQILARKAMEKGVCRGFNGFRVLRGTFLGEFLTDRDPQGKLKRSVQELQDHCPRSLIDCRNIAIEHAKQLFAICQNKEDPCFPTGGGYLLFSEGS